MLDEHLGEINVTSHRINTMTEAPTFKQCPRRTGPKTREFVADEFDCMCKANIIELATAEWASLVVVVTKHDVSKRMCIDYR